ncbi:hypothetical protein AQUCO_02800041v1 [Aquilegia coerulea]|uniref:Uncharacterized protein n=1 Tax=Aquilegia coerulea TaxID=218851 RepID=A0A2G5D3N4_AQUCA|nr:hypothetical protein AQUCO_02800041v1 [Aquilegia coerulea]
MINFDWKSEWSCLKTTKTSQNVFTDKNHKSCDRKCVLLWICGLVEKAVGLGVMTDALVFKCHPIQVFVYYLVAYCL